MGITLASAQFLIEEQSKGGFGHTVTLGRQNLMASPRSIAKLLKDYGIWTPAHARSEAVNKLYENAPYFADAFLHEIGADKVSAVDISDFEGADYLQDMNKPIAPEWQAQFDTVIDGGLLEHVFNFPVALQNCMEMVRENGRLIILTPCNNYCGHGFYQFSPELFYRTLSEENGFRIERMVAVENDSFSDVFLDRAFSYEIMGKWFDVVDPAQLRQRGLLVNNRPTLLFLTARRIAIKPVFEQTPQQSDYAVAWEQHEKAAGENGQSVISRQAAQQSSLKNLRRFVKTSIIHGAKTFSRISGRNKQSGTDQLHWQLEGTGSLFRRFKPFFLKRVYAARSLGGSPFFQIVKHRKVSR